MRRVHNQKANKGCFPDRGNQSTTSLGCSPYPYHRLSTICIIIHLSISPKLTMLLLWPARPLSMQVLFTAIHQKVLEVEQEQRQEVGPGPDCKFLANWIPEGCQASRKCKSLFQWSLWSIFTPPTWCWSWLECRLRGYFWYNVPLPLAAKLYSEMCSYQACWQYPCLLSRG